MRPTLLIIAAFATTAAIADVPFQQLADFGKGGSPIDVNADGVQDLFPVEEAFRLNGYLDFRPGGRDGPVRVRVGANNLLDEAPPLVDDSLGYAPDYHWLKGREFYVQVRTDF